MKEPIGHSHVALAPQEALDRNMPLIPRDSVAERSLVVVIAIMTFLAGLTVGGATLLMQASRNWQSDVLREVTIQVKPRAEDDVESLLAKVVSVATHMGGVKRARAYTAYESAKLLEPWLGEGLDLSHLPVPRIVAIDMQGEDDAKLVGLRDALARSVPQAALSDRRIWADRIGVMANSVVALALALFALMIIAMAIAVAFATRGAVAGNRDTLEVLHIVGASDRFIAREFESHFRSIGFRGALTGGSAALAFFFAAATLSWDLENSPGGAHLTAIFGGLALRPIAYVALIIVGGAVTLLTGLVSRLIVFRYLGVLR